MPIAPDGTYYELHGPEGAQVIALIHGLGLCSKLFQPHLKALSQNYRVLNYDLYGHGESKPDKEQASLSVYAKQLANLMDYLKIDKAAIIGFSIGGMINRRFALDFPEKLSALAILNSPHDRGGAMQEEVEARAKIAHEQGAMSTMNAALKRWFTTEYLDNSDGSKKVREWRENAHPESYAQAAWVLANGVRELIRPTTPITVPTLVITCESDLGSTPKMSHDIASEITGSETFIIPRLKHLGLMESPSIFTDAILEFLGRHKI